MSRVLLAVVVLSSGLVGGYLSPLAGITLFFGLVTLVFLTLPAIAVSRERLAALVFASYAAASVIWTVDTWGTILFAGSLIAGALLYVALMNVRGWNPLLVKCAVLAGVVNGAAETLAQAKLIPHGLFYNTNPFSGFQTPVVFLALYLYHRSGNKVYAWAASFLVFSNFLSRSRAGIVAMLLAMVVLAVYFWKQRDRAALAGMVRMTAAGFAGFLLFSFGMDLLGVESTKGLVEKGTPGIMQRAYLLKATLQTVLTAPVFGHGLNTFKGVINAYSSPYVMEPAIHAHSLYLNILVELGSVGLILFAAILWLVFRGRLFSSKVFFKLALLAFLAHNLVEYNFPAPGFQMLLYLLAALCTDDGTEEKPLFTLRGWRARFSRSLVLVYFLLVQIAPMVGFRFVQRASAALGRNDLEGTAGNLLWATYFGYAVSNTHEHLAFFLGNVYLSSDQKDPRLLSLVEANYRKAIALNTVDGDLYAKVAEFYRRLGRRQEAIGYLDKAMERYPHYQKYRVAYAEVLAEDGQQEKALRLLEEVNDFLRRTAPLEPVRVRTLLTMAQLNKMKGDEERYREYTGQATRLRAMLPRQPGPLR